MRRKWLLLTLLLPVLASPALADVQDVVAEASPFLLTKTVAETRITPPVAHTVVRQTWTNPNAHPVDGLYVFPLPEKAAVSELELVIGERRIRGEIKRRAEARAAYEKARAEGRVAALLDQERDNVFAQRVANIMPGATIEVRIAFDQPIVAEAGELEYVFPTVVGPRFVPASMGDPGEIAPPVAGEGVATGHRFHFDGVIDAGVPIEALRSPSHRIRAERERADRLRVRLRQEAGAKLDRDLVLRWRQAGRRPEIGVLAWRDPQEKGEPGAFLIRVEPPATDASITPAPRELVFVLDCSGSMHGEPLTAAKNVVRRALRAARPDDRFRILRFSESASGLSPEALAPTPANIERALRYLEGLRGGGGTHMRAGIEAALNPPTDGERLRIVAFLTDGYIGNEREIFHLVRQKIGAARLFSFGVGSSVNRYLLEGLAEEGRGMAAFIGLKESPDEMVERFVRRIATPVLTDLQLRWEGVEVASVEPARVPDLFAGQPLVLTGRYDEPGVGTLVVEAREAGRPITFRRTVRLPAQAPENEAIGRLWARRQIHRLERGQHGGEKADVREQITVLALRHRLMSAYTSLVAVDSEISNRGGSAEPVSVPVELPQGVDRQHTLGVRAASKGVLRMQMSYDASGRVGEFSKVAPGSLNQPPSVLPRAATEDELRILPAEGAEKKEQDQLTQDFVSLTLHRFDGSALRLEADGELWLVEGAAQSLVRTLSDAELAELLRVLATAQPARWRGAGSGPRLVYEGGAVSRGTKLVSPVQRELARRLEALAATR